MPGLIVQMEGSNLPVWGKNYITTVEIPDAPADELDEDSYVGSAQVRENEFGFKIGNCNGGDQVALRRLEPNISTGTLQARWAMQATPFHTPSNGFVVLSSSTDTANAIFAGVWMDTGELAVFEQTGDWSGGVRVPLDMAVSDELHCKFRLDMDARTLAITVNGKSASLHFSEAVTSVDYIGFATRDAQTLFSEIDFN